MANFHQVRWVGPSQARPYSTLLSTPPLMFHLSSRQGGKGDFEYSKQLLLLCYICFSLLLSFSFILISSSWLFDMIIRTDFRQVGYVFNFQNWFLDDLGFDCVVQKFRFHEECQGKYLICNGMDLCVQTLFYLHNFFLRLFELLDDLKCRICKQM